MALTIFQMRFVVICNTVTLFDFLSLLGNKDLNAVRLIFFLILISVFEFLIF